MRRLDKFEVAIVVVLILVLIMLGGIAWSLNVAAEQRQRLIECTTPGYACYDEGQARTGEAVAQIVEELTREGKVNTERILEAIRSVEVAAR